MQCNAYDPCSKYPAIIWSAGFSVCLLPLVLFIRTLAPAEVGGDAGEFQVVPYVLGIAHYTGYPFYTLLGWLWSHLIPWSSPDVRLNLLSACFGALSDLVVFLCIREIGGSTPAALVGGLALATFPLEWRWSTIAGVRAAAGTFTALLFLVLFRWINAVIAKKNELHAKTHARWFILVFVFGLALAHHRSSMFFFASLAIVAMLLPRSWPAFRTILVSLALFILPLLLYLYLPLRSAAGAPYDQFHPTTWPRFVDLVFAPQLTRSLLSVPPTEWLGRALTLGTTLRNGLGLLWIIAAIGLAGLLLQRTREMLALSVFGALVSAQVINWNIGPQLNVVYLIPVYVICAILIGWGIETLMRAACKIHRAPLWPYSILSLTALALVALHGRETYIWQRTAAERTLDAYHQNLTAGWLGHRLFAAALPYLSPHTVFAGDWEQATIAWYEKLVSKRLPEMSIDFGNGSLSSLSYAKLRREFGSRPIVLGRAVSWAVGHHPSAVGPLISLSSRPRYQPPPGITPDILTFQGGFSLLGYQLFDERGNRVQQLPQDSPILPLMLIWRADEVQTHNLSVSLRLLNKHGNVVRSQDRSSPVYGLAPVTSWVKGEVVSDYYELPLRGLAPGMYTLALVLYYQPKPGQFVNLHLIIHGKEFADTTVPVLTVVH